MLVQKYLTHYLYHDILTSFKEKNPKTPSQESTENLSLKLFHKISLIFRIMDCPNLDTSPVLPVLCIYEKTTNATKLA